MKGAKGFVVTSVVCFLLYLILTANSTTPYGPNVWIWSMSEFIAAMAVGIIVGFIAKNVFVKKLQFMNPVRWIAFAYFVFVPFFWGVIKSNIDVAIRVITGKINPGIVKIHPKLKTDLGITMLATSITLTPGTVSVEIDENDNSLYVHWIDVADKNPTSEQVAGSFEKWAKRVME
jgi:multicomponent Na+:H+ antiporter subunit E